MGAPLASDSGSNDDDDVPMSKQHTLDSDSNNNTNKCHHKKQHNANAKMLLAINAEKAKLNLKHLSNTVPGYLPDGWETMMVCGCHKCQNDFRGILHPNFYWSPTTNVVFVGDKAVFAHSTGMTGISYIFPHYELLYWWAPQGMPMNPEQLHLLLKLIQEGQARVTMWEQIHAALLIQKFQQISFYTAPDLQDCTMWQVMELTPAELETSLPKGDCHWIPVPLPSCLSAMHGHTDNNMQRAGLSQVLINCHFNIDAQAQYILHYSHPGSQNLYSEVVRAVLAQVEEPFFVDSSTNAAPTKEGPSLSVAMATTDCTTSSGASSQNAPTEESMELDYTDDSVVPTNPQPEVTPPVIPSPLDAAVTTNVATPAAPEAGSSGSIDMANTILEC
ncbi:hypothetical protein C0989_005468 [Termitomyces sp. Mn162]|nr:hypothetical protein C0989_005468 [Termitomyces sp. Mn162]